LDAGLAEGTPDGAGVDPEVLSDPGQRPALVVKVLGLVEAIGQKVSPSWSTGPFNVLHDRGATTPNSL